MSCDGFLDELRTKFASLGKYSELPEDKKVEVAYVLDVACSERFAGCRFKRCEKLRQASKESSDPSDTPGTKARAADSNPVGDQPPAFSRSDHPIRRQIARQIVRQMQQAAEQSAAIDLEAAAPEQVDLAAQEMARELAARDRQAASAEPEGGAQDKAAMPPGEPVEPAPEVEPSGEPAGEPAGETGTEAQAVEEFSPAAGLAEAAESANPAVEEEALQPEPPDSQLGLGSTPDEPVDAPAIGLESAAEISDAPAAELEKAAGSSDAAAMLELEPAAAAEPGVPAATSKPEPQSWSEEVQTAADKEYAKLLAEVYARRRTLMQLAIEREEKDGAVWERVGNPAELDVLEERRQNARERRKVEQRPSREYRQPRISPNTKSPSTPGSRATTIAPNQPDRPAAPAPRRKRDGGAPGPIIY